MFPSYSIERRDKTNQDIKIKFNFLYFILSLYFYPPYPVKMSENTYLQNKQTKVFLE